MTNARRVYQATGLVLFLIALALIYGSWSMRYYSSLGPGPGFFPLWLSIGLAVLSLAMIAQATFGDGGGMPEDFLPDPGGSLRVLGVLVALTATALFLERLGFAVATFLMNLLALRILGYKSVIGTLIIAVIGSFGAYYFFTKWLSVPLPEGLLSF